MIKEALEANRESKYIEFKERFNPESLGDWCEIIKDIIAISNSGSGIIIFGVNNNGIPTGEDISSILNLDNATIQDKIYKYTHYDLIDIQISEQTKESFKLALFIIKANDIPIVFVKPGLYNIPGKKLKRSFSKGTIYFRHGAKSEPGTTNDLRNFFNRKLNNIRKEWLSGVQKVVKAAPGSSFQLLPPHVISSDSPNATPIRITDDIKAPLYGRIDPNITNPLSQKKLIEIIHKELPERQKFNWYDIRSIKKVYRIENDLKYYYNPKFGRPQYSHEFAKWIIDKYKKDKYFFYSTRMSFRRGNY